MEQREDHRGRRKILAPDAGKAVCEVFLKLVPMHLAIAPRVARRYARSRTNISGFCAVR